MKVCAVTTWPPHRDGVALYSAELYKQTAKLVDLVVVANIPKQQGLSESFNKIKYRDIEIGTHRLDMVIENQIIIELKAIKELTDVHYAQLRSYLKATGLKIGLLLNIAKPTLEIKRIVN